MNRTLQTPEERFNELADELSRLTGQDHVTAMSQAMEEMRDRLFTQGNGHYSWWSHFANARARNVGWRIDYVLVSPQLRAAVKAAEIHANVMGSDHCPVSITLA